MIQMNLFRRHTFALHHKASLMICANPSYVARSVLPRLGQEEVSTVAIYAGFEGCQKFRQTSDRGFFDGACFVFKLVVVWDRCRCQIASIIESLRVVPNRGALDLKRHPNRGQQPRLLALIRDCPRRRYWRRARHALFQDDDVQLMRTMHPSHQWTHISGGAGTGDKDKVTLNGFAA